ncbi:Ycf16 (nucleomorph) [Bigelowiella natans]|uniref:Ycf16 n=2 Tax=Bigelowiella natans TaxID=227086 RepID=Q3LW04_BIGNA|nr:Ycf16 [Bigelowiella natans]ABA27362.1 Ycf16 [Bigelowiella natans]|mmetsp:Transcript_2103/g.2628  ORF Transcript_2103/g.2628 Transcript_2103/m.2628 type:complete len:269 (+) Transcript_2103:400-1206(+)
MRRVNAFSKSISSEKVLDNINKLKISDLSIILKSNNTKIVENLNLTVNPGEIHVLMGRNGSGKSTLSKTIVGHPSYEVIDGSITYKNIDITQIDASLRALNGIFMCFQSPVEIQGVKNLDFLRKISNSRRKFLSQPIFDPLDFYSFISDKIESVGLDNTFLTRNVNEGFSGGEKKRNEMLQLITVQADFCIFDEIDSGLDIDSIKNLVDIISTLRNRGVGMIIITHYNKLIDLVRPDYVHILKNGKIIKSGDMELSKIIEREGFDAIN